MKERPILFSGEMVRAILAGRKTQTRRVCKFRITGPNPPNESTFDVYDGKKWVGAFGRDKKGNALKLCPYGQPGDRLWVREAFQPLHGPDAYPDWKTGRGYDISFPATEGRREYQDWNTDSLTDRISPAIHMPRWASRISLEITKVRVESVTDISVDDCFAEGIPSQGGNSSDGPTRMQMKFADLWDSINEKRGFAWYKNPWVRVIEFSRAEATHDH